MSSKKFIENQLEVKQLLQKLKLCEVKNHQVEIYINPITNQKWEKYEFEFEDDGSTGTGLRCFPYCSIKTTIHIALNSDDTDEVDGAATLLYEFDRQGHEVRKPLLEAIEKRLAHISLDRFETIYWRTALYDKTNNRSIVGKKWAEIKKDASFFLETAEWANTLREKISGANKAQDH